MALLGDKRLVKWHIPSQDTSQKPGLHEEMARNGDLLLKHRMLEGFPFSLLIGFDDGLPTVRCEFDGTSFADDEIPRPDLLAIDKRNDEPIREPGTKFFHEIESQSRTVGPLDMEKADERIKAGRRQSGDAIVPDERIEEGEQAVHTVERWLAGSGSECEVGLLLFKQASEGAEVGLRSGTFKTANRIRGFSIRNPGDDAADGINSRTNNLGRCRVFRLARSTEKRVPGILKLAGNDAAADLGGKCSVIAGAVLGAAQGYAGIRHAGYPRLQATVFVKVVDRHGVLPCEAHGSGAQKNVVPENANTLHMVDREGEFERPVVLDPQRQVVARHVEAGHREIEYILEDFAHGRSDGKQGFSLRCQTTVGLRQTNRAERAPVTLRLEQDLRNLGLFQHCS